MAQSEWLVSDLVERLQTDPWRSDNPFSADMQRCHDVLFDPGQSRTAKMGALNDWMAENQPCLFGQMEAKQKRLAYCLLNENDLERGDDRVRHRIEEDRLDWKRRAESGGTHGFVILAISERIATARQNDNLLRLAERLCELYLGIAELDKILHDDLVLRIEGGRDVKRRAWKVGVKYFSSQADGRWWRDHRIPGGMAFSMNSVGHMARALAERMLRKDADLADRYAAVPREKLVYWALPKAMKTIGPPTEDSARGTWLAVRGSFEEDKEPPTFEQRHRAFGDLALYSENRYKGHYHTDETIPTVYFDEGLWKREDLKIRDDLFFTYLHSDGDPDYASMGLGEEIDAAEKRRDSAPQAKGATP